MSTVARRWTVTTWNLRGSEDPPLDEIADVLAATGSDVIALQEVQRDQAETLAERLGMRHEWAHKHWARTPLLPSRAEGSAILSPHAMRDAGSRALNGRSTWSWRRRIVQWALVERSDHSAYRVVNLHLTPHDEPDERLAEVRKVAEWFPVGTGAPLVVAGDLNDDGQPGVVDGLPGRSAGTVPATCPAGAPTQRLDHVLVPEAATDVRIDVPAGGPDWARRSDHLPVTVSFALDWVQGDFTAPG